MADFAKNMTVTLGSFSCTLSGFDDPFPLMRTVVDHFQEFTDHNPDFGTLPPKTNADNLKRLAEETTGMPVTAEMLDDDIVLRALDEDLDEDLDEQNTYLAIDDQLEAFEVNEEPVEDEVSFDEATDIEDDLDEIEGEDIAEPSEESSFGHLEMEDLDDQVFENLDPTEIYDEIEEEVTDEELQEDEDMAAYVANAIAFEDIDFDDEDTETDTTQSDAVESEAASDDPLPMWEAELNSDEPLEQVEPEAEAHTDDAQPSDAEFEQTGNSLLNKIIEASEQGSDTQEADPGEDHASEPAATSEPLDQNDKAAQSLVLGFGSEESFDANKPISSSAVDMRETPKASEAFKEMGVFVEDEGDFSWDEEESVEASIDEAPMEPLVLSPVNAVKEVRDAPFSDFVHADTNTSLEELVEATGAYITVIKGKDTFTQTDIFDVLGDYLKNEPDVDQTMLNQAFTSALQLGQLQQIQGDEFQMSFEAVKFYQARQAG